MDFEHTNGALERDFQQFFGARLREERERLRFSQVQFAQLMGVRRQAQASYEEGKTSPTATYLHAAASRGVDVVYVLTGLPSPRAMREFAEVVALYRSSSDEVQRGITAMLRVTGTSVEPHLEDDDIAPEGHPYREFPRGGAPAASRAVDVAGDASIGQVVNAPIQTDAQTFNIGARPRKSKR